MLGTTAATDAALRLTRTNTRIEAHEWSAGVVPGEKRDWSADLPIGPLSTVQRFWEWLGVNRACWE